MARFRRTPDKEKRDSNFIQKFSFGDFLLSEKQATSETLSVSAGIIWMKKCDVAALIGVFLASLSVTGLRADDASPKTLPNGIALTLKDDYVEIRVATAHAFCLHLSTQPDQGPYSSVFLKDTTTSTTSSTPPFTVVNEGPAVGIKTAFGELLVNPAKETWTLRDETGVTLTDWATLGKEFTPNPAKPATFRPVAGPSPTVEKPLYYGAGNTPHRGAITQPAGGALVGNGSAMRRLECPRHRHRSLPRAGA